MKRYLIDVTGNYLFFAPIVIALAGFAIPAIFGTAMWTTALVVSYLIGAVPIAAAGGRLFTAFLKHVWYPLFGEEF